MARCCARCSMTSLYCGCVSTQNWPALMAAVSRSIACSGVIVDSTLCDVRAPAEAAEFASDGAEALERAAAFKPDLVIMDLNMPGMDGWEATERLKKMPDPPRITVFPWPQVGDHANPTLGAQLVLSVKTRLRPRRLSLMIGR